MKLKDTLKRLYGRLQIFEIKDGERSLVLDDYNTILDLGKASVLNLICGDSSYYINQMAIGNGCTPLVSPAVTDTALDNQIGINPITSHSVDTVNSVVVFEATFNSTDYVAGDFGAYDQEINEAALFNSNDVIFARKTFNARSFSIGDSITLAFRWTIGVA